MAKTFRIDPKATSVRCKEYVASLVSALMLCLDVPLSEVYVSLSLSWVGTRKCRSGMIFVSGEGPRLVTSSTEEAWTCSELLVQAAVRKRWLPARWGQISCRLASWTSRELTPPLSVPLSQSTFFFVHNLQALLVDYGHKVWNIFNCSMLR
jgi:hypothetical protein